MKKSLLLPVCILLFSTVNGQPENRTSLTGLDSSITLHELNLSFPVSSAFPADFTAMGPGYPGGSQFGYDSRKSPKKAVMKAVLNTVIPTAAGIALIELSAPSFNPFTGEGGMPIFVGGLMIVYGVYVGPSTGSFYANDPARAFGGIIARGIATVLIINSDVTGRRSSGEQYLGYGLFLGSAVYNIISSGASARRFNRIYSGNTVLEFNPVADVSHAFYGIRFTVHL